MKSSENYKSSYIGFRNSEKHLHTVIFYDIYHHMYRKIFIVLAFFLLFMPLLNLSFEKKSSEENRILSPFPAFIKEKKINSNFGLEFNSYLNDHFGWRQTFINLRFRILNKINGRLSNEKAFVGDDGWVFDNIEIKYAPPLAQQHRDIKTTVSLLIKLNTILENKGVPLYLVIVPSRTRVMKRYWRGIFPEPSMINYPETVISALSQLDNIHIIYPYNTLLKESFKHNVFWKNDIHLTGIGTSILSREVLKVIKKDFFLPNDFDLIPDIRETCLPWGSLAIKLGIHDKLCDTYRSINFSPTERYKYIRYRNHKTIGAGYAGIIYQDGSSAFAPVNKAIHILGGCYVMDAIHPLLKFVFKKSTVYKTTGGKYDSSLRREQKNRFVNFLKTVNSDNVLMLLINGSFIDPEDDTFNIISDALEEF